MKSSTFCSFVLLSVIIIILYFLSDLKLLIRVCSWFFFFYSLSFLCWKGVWPDLVNKSRYFVLLLILLLFDVEIYLLLLRKGIYRWLGWWRRRIMFKQVMLPLRRETEGPGVGDGDGDRDRDGEWGRGRGGEWGGGRGGGGVRSPVLRVATIANAFLDFYGRRGSLLR